MRTNGAQPKRKGPWKPQHNARHILAVDPGRAYAIAGWTRHYNQIIVAQGTTHASDVPVTHRLFNVVGDIDMATRFISLNLDLDVLALEYPIPFYRASRESIAAVNIHAGVWAATVPCHEIQMFSPGNSKNLHVWNNKGAGLEEAEAFLAANPHKCIHPDSVDNAMEVDLTAACRRYPKFLDCAKVRLTKDAKSAVGILLCAMRYNNIPLPVKPSVFYTQL